jgi:hypothetical protein
MSKFHSHTHSRETVLFMQTRCKEFFPIDVGPRMTLDHAHHTINKLNAIIPLLNMHKITHTTLLNTDFGQ